jgi:molecular chaperone DnaK (HSP70)
VDLELSRADFERLILPLVGSYRRCQAGHTNHPSERRCAICGGAVEGQPLLSGRALELTRRALAHPSVNLSPDQVDHVLMAGNSTNIPLVQRTMEELFGPAKVVRKVHPKHAVAMGAAMVAAWMGQQCVCTAPDPEDATRECGHVNDDEAKACKRCGAALGAEGVSELSTLDRHAVAVSLGGIAPFSYGTGTAGDAFHVFIRKGDPFPTQSPESQVFRTRIPRQRMVSIPIFGGDNPERASANEKQGEAFAVLPPDLPVGTVVRVKLWLDRDGVFDVAAHLEDGSDLKPWVVKGEQDARAIDVIQQVDKALAAEGAHLPAAALAEVDAARSRVFERLRRHDFEGALHEAAQAQARIEDAATDSQRQSPEAAARGLLRWAEFVLDRYGWAFDPTMVYRLQGLFGALRDALASRDASRISAATQALDSATATLPDVVDLLLRMRHTIATRVRPADPSRAAALLRRQEQLEDSLRRGAPGARSQLDALVAEIVSGAKGAARAAGLQCSRGHAVPKGERRCPECGEDTWSLDAGAGGARGGS